MPIVTGSTCCHLIQGRLLCYNQAKVNGGVTAEASNPSTETNKVAPPEALRIRINPKREELMTKAKYFEGTFLDLECGHRLWKNEHKELFEQFYTHPNSGSPLREELECPYCPKGENNETQRDTTKGYWRLYIQENRC